MAGGVGSRFWPKSRSNFPKQFIDILGVGKSLLQLTYARFEKLCPADNIFIVTNKQYASLVKEQLPRIKDNNILCEPSRNNTAPCIAYATFKLAQLDPEANMLIAPSDHFIVDEDEFIRKATLALDFASNNNRALVTLGITPTRPDTGYGYIKFNKNPVSEGVFKVERFTEKPPLEKATEFVKSGDYVWNAGIFIWKVAAALEAFQKYAEDIFNLFDNGKDIYNTAQEQAYIDQYYPQSPNISIDFAIMEKSDEVYTIPADFGWSDLGTWGSLYEVAGKNDQGNAVSGSSLQLQEVENCIIHIPGNKIAVIRGLKDYIVVDEKDVLLIYPKNQEQEIKKVTERLKKDSLDRYL